MTKDRAFEMFLEASGKWNQVQQKVLNKVYDDIEDDIKVAVACAEETLIMHYEDKIDKLKKDLKEMDEMSADLAAIIVKRDKQIEAMQNYVDYSQRELL